MLRPADIRAAAEAALELATLRARYEGASLDALFGGIAPRRIRYARSWLEVERIGALTRVLAGRLPLAGGTGTCLKLAVVRFALLRRRGLNVAVHLGVRRAGGELQGHAWLSLNGEPLWEEPGALEGFRETYRYPRAEAAAA